MQRVGERAAAAPRVTGGARWSTGWALEPVTTTTVVLSAGADRRIAVDGLGVAAVAAVQRWASGGVIRTDDDEQRLLVDRLVEVGAVDVTAPSASRVTAVWIGPTDDDLVTALEGTGLDVVGTKDAVTTTLAIRTADGPAPRIDGPHLGVDLTMHHTVLVGPLVVPGITSCLGCLRHRAARRWGDPVVPVTPAIRRWPAVVAQLVAVQVELAAAGRSPLVNATIAWDLEQGTTDRQHLYKQTGCPTCDVARATGRIELPT